jgi:hypothetical protein
MPTYDERRVRGRLATKSKRVEFLEGLVGLNLVSYSDKNINQLSQKDSSTGVIPVAIQTIYLTKLVYQEGASKVGAGVLFLRSN